MGSGFKERGCCKSGGKGWDVCQTNSAGVTRPIEVHCSQSWLSVVRNTDYDGNPPDAGGRSRVARLATTKAGGQINLMGENSRGIVRCRPGVSDIGVSTRRVRIRIPGGLAGKKAVCFLCAFYWVYCAVSCPPEPSKGRLVEHKAPEEGGIHGPDSPWGGRKTREDEFA
jgi:hypothetical protein